MNSQPTHLMARASIAIEQQPHRLTKTQLVKRIGGKRRRALEAVDLLCSQGYAATTAGPRGWLVYHSLKRYPDEQTDPGTGIPLPTGTGGVPDGNSSAPAPTASAGPAKDGEVRPTATEATNCGEPAPVCQPRCKVCKSPELLHKVNAMLANGFTTGAILNAIAGTNGALPAQARITDDSLHRHRHRHFPVQAGASSVWRELMERRAEAESATYQEGVSNLLTPRIFFETMMIKSYAGLNDDAVEIGPDLGLRAAAELHKMTAADGGTDQMAKIVATQNRIVAAFRLLPAPLQQQVLDTVEGRATPPPGGARLALVESVATDDDFGSDDEDFEDDDFRDDED